MKKKKKKIHQIKNITKYKIINLISMNTNIIIYDQTILDNHKYHLIQLDIFHTNHNLCIKYMLEYIIKYI